MLASHWDSSRQPTDSGSVLPSLVPDDVVVVIGSIGIGDKAVPGRMNRGGWQFEQHVVRQQQSPGAQHRGDVGERKRLLEEIGRASCRERVSYHV